MENIEPGDVRIISKAVLFRPPRCDFRIVADILHVLGRDGNGIDVCQSIPGIVYFVGRLLSKQRWWVAGK